MEGDDDDEDGDGKSEMKEKEIKEEKKEEEEKESPMELQAEEDDVDPLDAYMEEVKQEVKKFNMGAMKGNDKVREEHFFVLIRFRTQACSSVFLLDCLGIQVSRLFCLFMHNCFSVVCRKEQ